MIHSMMIPSQKLKRLILEMTRGAGAGEGSSDGNDTNATNATNNKVRDSKLLATAASARRRGARGTQRIIMILLLL